MALKILGSIDATTPKPVLRFGDDMGASSFRLVKLTRGSGHTTYLEPRHRPARPRQTRARTLTEAKGAREPLDSPGHVLVGKSRHNLGASPRSIPDISPLLPDAA